MGYRPDPEAARLMSYLKRSAITPFESVLGILNEYPSDAEMRRSRYTAELIHGAERRAKELGYAIDILALGQDGMSPRRMDQIIHARGIRGVLVPPEPEPLFSTGLDWKKIAAVATTTTALPLRLHRVLPHNFSNLRIILDALLERDYRRIGLIRWPQLEERQMFASSAIYALYAHVERKIARLPLFEWRWKEPEEKRRKRIAAWVAKAKPEVVLGFGDYNLEVLKAATGMRVPEDIGFASYGECDPEIARLEQCPARIGAAAMDLLTAQVKRGDAGIPSVPKTTLIEGVFVAGTTLRN